jgi:hypothetical protein
MRRVADPIDAAVGLGDHSRKRRVGEVGQLAALALEVGPQRLDRVQLRRVGGQPVGARYWVTLCDLPILMDQSTESISPYRLPTGRTAADSGLLH